jgi:predicted nucleotidyltransferase
VLFMAQLLLRDLAELRRRLAPHLAHAQKAIVFGSVARGEADSWSDLDLIIVADTTRPFFERSRTSPACTTCGPGSSC